MADHAHGSRVAVITGGNSGVGLATAEQLLAHGAATQTALTVVLACRNVAKAQQAQRQLQARYPGSDVRVQQLDTSSVASVLRAVSELGAAYSRLDLLFCNAGAMAIAGLDIPGIARGLLTHPVAFFESSEALRQRRGLTTQDGLGLTFQTNVFGHYLLVDRLVPLLAGTGGARVIWTGSSASHLDFSPADYQHIHGPKPYESSKFIVDQIAQPLDARLRKQGVCCYIAEPGNVCSGFLAGLDMPAFQLLVLVVFYLLRIVAGIPRFTVTASCGAAACVHLALADGDKLDPRIKYHSCSTRAGAPYVVQRPLAARAATGDFLVAKLDSLVARLTAAKAC
ncbi:hypothetical protein H4R19_000370 [Coemansia spiralis]|nr:hypothetical protein H4R19_000370 [Coemansia spiralis]